MKRASQCVKWCCSNNYKLSFKWSRFLYIYIYGWHLQQKLEPYPWRRQFCFCCTLSRWSQPVLMLPFVSIQPHIRLVLICFWAPGSVCLPNKPPFYVMTLTTFLSLFMTIFVFLKRFLNLLICINFHNLWRLFISLMT